MNGICFPAATAVGRLTGLYCALWITSIAGAWPLQEPTPPTVAEDAPSFNQQVRPILSQHCFPCHGPDAEHRQAGIRLDIAGEADLDEVLARISAEDPDVMMPPAEFAKPLSPEQIALLQRWIEDGGTYQEHWSFRPVASPEVPAGNPQWSSRRIDRWVWNALQRQGLQPKSRADRRTLIRRVTLDLTGLPPTPSEIEAFLADESEQAYERLVDRLLASPHYGEHQARYWLDLVRFADTNGLHHDHFRQMTPFRDWVIRAFNDNLSFADFVRDQLAGDLLESPSQDQLIASGFNRLHLIIDRGTALPEESFHRNVVDRITAVGTAFMGITVQCAECHDHKYDPLTQREFYQLYGFFDNFDGDPETGGRQGSDFRRGLQPPYINLPSPQQEAQLAALDTELADLDRQLARFTLPSQALAGEIKKLETLVAQGGAEATTWQADLTLLQEHQQRLNAERSPLQEQRQAKQKERDDLEFAIPAALVMKERAEPRPTHIRIRGVYDQLGEVVPRDTPAFLPPLEARGEVPDRLDLAHWLISGQHPLTARVAVNRFWQQLFGVGLVKTSEDLGAQGQPPSHPELLDDLAQEFVESGWDVKRLLRSIVLSETYQQDSRATPDEFRRDPENRRLARGSRFRLDAEVIRDQILVVSGLLNPEMYGPSVKPPQPEGLWKTVAMPYSYPRVFEPDEGPAIYRRSVYTFWKRAIPPPQMSIFDAPTREACIARRERTNTPLQALLMMNEQQYFRAAMKLAGDLLASVPTDPQRLQAAYQRITSRQAPVATVEALQQALNGFAEEFARNPDRAQAMVETYALGEAAGSRDPLAQQQLAAWTMVVHALLNLDQFKVRQ